MSFYKCFTLGFLWCFLAFSIFIILNRAGIASGENWKIVVPIWLLSFLLCYIAFFKGIKPTTFIGVSSNEQKQILRKGSRLSAWAGSGSIAGFTVIIVAYEIFNI